MKQNVQFSTTLLSQFLVFSLCLFLSMNTFAQKPQLSSTMETGGKSVQVQEEEETTNTLEIPTLIQSSSQAVQKQQKSDSEEITLNGPFCNGCDDPKGGSSLACSGGNNFIIQGIDISSRTRDFFVNSIDFNQESFNDAPNVRVRLFCGTAGTVHHSATHTALYTETFTTKKSDDGKCVNFALTTPPTIDPACGTTLWIEFRTTSGDRVVSTPKKCNGSTATGNLTYIRAPGCSINTPKKAKNVGFKLDASFAINIADVFGIKGDIEYCASEEKTTLDAAGDWTNYLWSNGATTQTMDVIDGTYAVTVTDIAGATATDEVTVIQHANPVPAIAGELEYCAADLHTTLDVGKWESYSWNNNQTSQNIDAMAGTHMVMVTDENGCTGTDEVEVESYSVPVINMEGTGMVNSNNSTGNRVYVVEVCGGKTSYDYDFTSSEGFASISEQPSENTNCRNYQIVYGVGVIWTLTVTDLDICEDKPVTFTNEGLITNPEIAEMTINPETCVGEEDGSIEVEVEGGNDSCEEYTYTWSGPNGFSETISDDATGSIVEDLASGIYNLTVSDCTGASIMQTGINVSRTNGGSGRGRGRGGCKTAGNNFNDLASLKAFPNPFGQITSIEFSIAETSKVWISIYSVEGRKVAEILKGEKIEGNTPQRLGFDAEKLQNGVYVLELQTESGLRQHQQLVAVK